MVYEYSLDWFPGGIYWEIRVWFPASTLLPPDLDFIAILM